MAAHSSWLAVWKNLRAQTMPPADEAQPKEADRKAVVRRIEHDIFRLDPANPDPGRVTIRRLNRTEYSYTIYDSLVSISTQTELSRPTIQAMASTRSATC